MPGPVQGSGMRGENLEDGSIGPAKEKKKIDRKNDNKNKNRIVSFWLT